MKLRRMRWMGHVELWGKEKSMQGFSGEIGRKEALGKT
jgi:hypothetical protein